MVVIPGSFLWTIGILPSTYVSTTTAEVNLRNTHFSDWTQLIIIGNILYLVSLVLTKVSILLFYRRLFNISKWFRWTVHGAITFVIGYCAGAVFAIIFECSPPAATWNIMLRLTSHCADIVHINTVIGVFNIFSDFFILLLPLPMLWKLQMPTSKKLGLMVILTSGSLYVQIDSLPPNTMAPAHIFINSVCITAIIRENAMARTFDYSDESWSVCESMIWQYDISAST